jgi:hypothetical protein
LSEPTNDERTIEKWKERDRQGEEKYEQWQKSKEEEQIAAGLQKLDFTRHVPSGAKRTLEFIASVNPDCSLLEGTPKQGHLGIGVN